MSISSVSVCTASQGCCPTCGENLESRKDKAGVLWLCSKGHGRARKVSHLRQALLKDFVNQLWWRSQELQNKSGRACPFCQQEMGIGLIPAGEETLTLDLCHSCQLVWFDAGEYERCPAPPTLKEAPLPPELFQLFAWEKEQAVADERRLIGWGLGALSWLWKGPSWPIWILCSIVSSLVIRYWKRSRCENQIQNFH